MALEKKYGIYICYPPTVDLRCEGLGRYLSSFVKGALDNKVKLLIACPSWSKDSLFELFKNENISLDSVEILSPIGKPFLLNIFNFYSKFQDRKQSLYGVFNGFGWVRSWARRVIQQFYGYFENKIASANSVFDVVPLFFLIFSMFLIGLMFSPVISVLFLSKKIYRFFHDCFSRVKPFCFFRKLYRRVQNIVSSPKDDGIVFRLYKLMETEEAARINALIKKDIDVCGWYCPTAYWPSFHDIKAPKLMCVPDVVLSDFPCGFSAVGGDRFMDTFNTIRNSIKMADKIVTYSDSVKWRTLVKQHGIPSSRIAVVHHAVNDLSEWINVQGGGDLSKLKKTYSKYLIEQALAKSKNNLYLSTIRNFEFNYIFYASQFRPNKNIISLLKAYKYLLVKNKICEKLILTGDPNVMPEVAEFVRVNNLHNDVLFFPGLSNSELAAFYHNATISVNPSLSEGGFPFTFSESVSVNTPVVMSKIFVSEEFILDKKLKSMMLFDPYDWISISERILWGIENRHELLCVQRKLYAKLSSRTWVDVAREHLNIIDEMAG